MRTGRFISPTQLSMFEGNPSDYYLRYLAEDRPEKEAQTRPMSIGSAFDAYVKNYLFERLMGKGHKDWDKYDLDTLLRSQVDPVNLDWANTHGHYAFQCYKTMGALGDIMLELEDAANEPRFEFQVSDRLVIDGTVVPLLGKPDCHFVTKTGHWFVLDWKVNGYCSRSAVSPMPGYVGLRPGGAVHKSAHVQMIGNIKVNTNQYLDSVNKSWADQLVIYDWLTKAQDYRRNILQIGLTTEELTIAQTQPLAVEHLVSNATIYAIDQIVCKPDGEFPTLRVAQHRMLTNSQHEVALRGRLCRLWKCIQSQKTFFDDMTPEESVARCELLEKQAANYDPFEVATMGQ